VTNINATDYIGNTALHFACEKNHLALFKLLIGYKARVICNTRNLTPLMIAADKHSADIVSWTTIAWYDFWRLR